jgi:plasmid stability protein
MTRARGIKRQPGRPEMRVGQVLIRNISEGLIDAYKAKARLKGKSLEHVLRDVLERNAPFTPEERAALARQYVDELPERIPALTKEEIREGLL